MKYKIIRVFEDSEEYKYENLFLVRISEEQYNELLQSIEEYDNLDYEEAQEKYGMGKIEFVENYIMKNLDVINVGSSIDIDCY